jgi:formylglycine-generating enzyme required for sulfatase activity
MIADSRQATHWVTVPEGTFIMGESPEDKFATDTERPAHSVTFSHAFALARFPVTVREFRAFAPGHAPDDDPCLPVVNVSWDQAVSFCGWLQADRREAVRLPSEAEWEFACRAGRRSAFGAGDDLACEEANFFYSEEGLRVGPGRRTPEGYYPPNAFGLVDLQGNVCEWVADSWHSSYRGAPTDGSPWFDGGPHRVIRGGAWDYLPRLLRCAWRDGLPPVTRRDNLGFRLARSIDPQP